MELEVTKILDQKKKENANIYDEIQAKLEAAKKLEDFDVLVEAYKWLGNMFVEVNESARAFEDRAEKMLEPEKFGEILYGSKEAYEASLKVDELASNGRAIEALALSMETASEAAEHEQEIDLFGDR